MDKQKIIDEIKRSAEQNDGEPLGRQRFTSLTGIRKSEWYGIHWASWGEAIAEARYRPNEFTTGYDEKWLIELFIQSIREVGGWPVEGKLRILCRNNAKLPDVTTFKKRLGNKAERASKLLAYCQEHQGYDDIIAICKPIIRSSEVVAEDKEESGVETFGFVYLMKSGKYHKIGHSNAVGRREYELGTKLPEEIVTVHKIKTDDPEGVERYWHDRFKDKRKEGEWFELSTTDIKTFKKWRRIY